MVSLSSASAPQTITLAFATADAGTALAGTNYTSTSGTVTFTPGQTSQAIDIPILDDTALTAPAAMFTLNLSSPTNATLASTTATGTIFSNEGVQYNNPPANTNTGFAGDSQTGTINKFNYVIFNSRTDALADAQIQFFLTPIGANLDDATPFETARYRR